jgi:drug/metabolite transporter (DMT)-like permease
MVLAAGLAVVVLWASAFAAIRVAAPAFGSGGLSFVRLALAAGTLLAIAPICRVRRPSARDLGWILACAFFGMTAYQVLLNLGELHVSAGTASIIVAAAPIVSVATARQLFHERVTAFAIVGSLVAIAGVVIVCLSRGSVSLSSSVWIVIGAMVVQGIYHPLQKPLLQRYSGLEVATYAMVAGAIMIIPLAPFDWARIVAAPASAWLSAAYLGLLPSALGFVLWAYTVGRLSVAASTSLLYLVPPVAVLVAWVWLGERPVATELIGAGVVILGVLVISQGSRLAASSGQRTRQPSESRASALSSP